jgi:hypothetical protein
VLGLLLTWFNTAVVNASVFKLSVVDSDTSSSKPANEVSGCMFATFVNFKPIPS